MHVEAFDNMSLMLHGNEQKNIKYGFITIYLYDTNMFHKLQEQERFSWEIPAHTFHTLAHASTMNTPTTNLNHHHSHTPIFSK